MRGRSHPATGADQSNDLDEFDYTGRVENSRGKCGRQKEPTRIAAASIRKCTTRSHTTIQYDIQVFDPLKRIRLLMLKTFFLFFFFRIPVEIEEYESAAKLAEKYLDFTVLVKICDITRDDDRLMFYLDKYEKKVSYIAASKYSNFYRSL